MKKLIFTLLLFLSLPVWAKSSGDLLSYCKFFVKAIDGESLSRQESMDASFCAGFLNGIRDSHSYLDYIGNLNNKAFCVPAESDTSQLAYIVIKYFKENPEKLHFPPDQLTIMAFIEAFPCN